MDKNFDESQALRDMREILNNIYQIATNYHNELQTARSLNNDKAKKISDLEARLLAQEEKFRDDLKECTNHNFGITKQLEILHQELLTRQERLNERNSEIYQRETEIATREEDLQNALKALDEKKSRLENEYAEYDGLRKAAADLDNKTQEMQSQYGGRISELEELKADNERTIHEQQARITELEQKVANLQRQIEQLNAQIDRLQPEPNDGNFENNNISW